MVTVKIKGLMNDLNEKTRKLSDSCLTCSDHYANCKLAAIRDVSRLAQELELEYETENTTVAINSKYAKNIHEAAAICHITLAEPAVAYIINIYGPAMIDWTINDYINAVKKVTVHRKPAGQHSCGSAAM